jgi:modification methylase
MHQKPFLFNESSERLTYVAPQFVNKVGLVVTSPPYHNAISYSSHQADELADYRVRENLSYNDEYLDLLDAVWNECWKMLRPGGHLAINVGTVLLDGDHIPLSLDVQSQLRRSKHPWKFVKNIHWHKVTAGVRRAGTVIRHQLPGYWYPNIMSEHIIVVQKKGKPTLNKDVPDEWWDSIWDLAPVPPNTVKHPAPFPEDLPHRLIRMLTSVGEYVLDPFNGSGTTTKAAYDLERTGVGFDTSKKYLSLAEHRLTQSSKVRASQLLVMPTNASDFSPKIRKEPSRQGTGQSARRKNSNG